jgi:hypothetical protein
MHYAICLGIVSLLMGCSPSPYVEDYFYVPRPVVKNMPATHPSEPPTVSAFATVVGIRTADKKQSIPESIEVRLRIDNNGSQAIEFNPRSMQLTSGSLFRFPAPILESAGAVTVSSGESALVAASFPFPEGKSYKNLDLQTLILRWELRIGSKRIWQVANFHRQYPRYYYDPYWYYGEPYWGFYPYPPGPYFRGTVIVHGRR